MIEQDLGNTKITPSRKDVLIVNRQKIASRKLLRELNQPYR